MERLTEIESRESEPKLLCKVILMRHEKTEYTETGVDLTEDGIQRAKETGQRLKDDAFFSKDQHIISLHSPAPRAKGTSDLVLEAADLPTENSKPVNMIGPTEVFDVEAFEQHAEDLDEDPAQIAKAFYTHELHRDHPELVEPHLKKKERLYRAFEYLLRHAIKNTNDPESLPVQVFVVSHFEIITHLIDDVFGIENTGYRSPLLGEQVKISAFQIEDPDKVLLKVAFRDAEKEAIFNRKTRSIE